MTLPLECQDDRVCTTTKVIFNFVVIHLLSIKILISQIRNYVVRDHTGIWRSEKGISFYSVSPRLNETGISCARKQY